MTVVDTIEKPNLSAVILLEVTAGKWCRNWQATGFANVFILPTTLNITAVKFNGVVGVQKTSAIQVNGTLGSWYFDGQTLFASSPSGGTAIFTDTVVAVATFYFSTKAKTFNSQYYEPRLISAPNISMRIEPNFGGLAQVGGGNATLINNDGYFDTLADLKWNNGTAVLKFGTDMSLEKMALSDYITLATWLIEDWTKDSEVFTLKLRELKARANVNLPLSFFATAEYPSLPQASIGKPIPLAYGKVIGVQPILVDYAAKRFKVASHAVYSFDDVKVRGDIGWKQSNFATSNTATGEFTLGADWTGSEDVSVDFSGKKNADGTLMTNPSDIVKDLLATAGETSINTGSFTAAWNRLDAGTDEDGRRTTLRSPSLYISDTRALFDIIGQINKEVGSFLYVDASGAYYYAAFEPSRGEALKQFDELDLISFAEAAANANSTGLDQFSKVAATYAKREAEAYSQIQVEENTGNQLSVGLGAAKVKDVDLDFFAQSDAQYYAQRFLVTEARRQKSVKVRFPWRGWLLQPGDQVRLDLDRFGGPVVAGGIGFMSVGSTFIAN